MLILEIQQPNWTDILQGVGAIIGVPGAIAAFVFLLIKDKQKQEQIDKLGLVAQKIEAQNEIMILGNALAEQQIEVLRKMLLNPSNVGYDKLAEIEESRYLLSMKPRLISNGGLNSENRVQFSINNFGETAFIVSVDDVSPESQLSIDKVNYNNLEIKKDGRFVISTFTKSGNRWNIEEIKHHFEIKYKDIAGNLYKQEIHGIVGKSYKTSEPELLEKTIK